MLLVLGLGLLATFPSSPAAAQSSNTWVYISQCFSNPGNISGLWSTYEEAGQACATAINTNLVSCSPSGPAQAGVISRCLFGDPKNPASDFELVEPATQTNFVSLDPVAKADCGGNCNSMGDPISPANGNVSLEQTDIPMQSGSPQSAFKRFYNSADQGSLDLGQGWRHSFSRSIVANAQATPYQQYFNGYSRNSGLYATPALACTSGWTSLSANSPWPGSYTSYANNTCSVWYTGSSPVATIATFSAFPVAPGTQNTAVTLTAVRDDGQTVIFTNSGSGWVPQLGSSLRLTTLSGGGYQLIDNDDAVELYNAAGQLTSVTTRGGVKLTMTPDSSGRLHTVVDSFGHQLTLGYNSANQLTSVQDPKSNSVLYARDSMGRLSTVTNLDSTTRTYVYENPEFPLQLTGIIDENNVRFATWGYDSQGRGNLTYEGGSLGADNVSFAYNTNNSGTGGNVTTTDALGQARTFTFSLIGNQNRVTSISGYPCPTCQESAATTYDSNGWVASRTDYNGNVSCYANDPVRGLELVRIEGLQPGSTCPANLATYPVGGIIRKIITQWSSTWREPSLITEATRTTGYTFDSSGNIQTKTITDLTVTPNVTRTWTYTYNSYGQVLTEQLPRTDVNSTTTYTYFNCSTGGNCGQVNTIKNALSQTTTFSTYDPYGRPLTFTDPNGVLTTLGYDKRERLTSSAISAAGFATETTGYGYYPTGILKMVTLPDSSTIAYTPDAAHRLTQITDTVGNYIKYTLDAEGNRTSDITYLPNGTVSRAHYRQFNTLGQLYQDISSANNYSVTTFDYYDNNGNLLNIDAPLGRTTSYLYEFLNRVRLIYDAAAGYTYLTHDDSDNLTVVQDPRGLFTNYTYNGFNDLVKLVSPDTGTTNNTFDSGGNLQTSKDARLALQTNSYDKLNRLMKQVYSDETIVFGYDSGTNGIGRLTSASDASHAMTWSYDAKGRVTGKGQTIIVPGVNVTKAVGYGYTNGDMVKMVTPSGQTLNYTFVNHRITAITITPAGSSTATTILSGATYDPFGPVTSWTWGNGSVESRFYTQDGVPSTFTSAGATNTYTEDAALRITNIADGGLSSDTWGFGYDLLDRVTSANSSANTQGYTYDANGNRLTETGTTPQNNAIGTTNNYLSPATLNYDAKGDITGGAGITGTYNQRGRLVAISQAAGSTSYTYNALGQFVAKTGYGGPVVLMYDEAGHIIGEYTATGVLIEETIWMGNLPVATIVPSGTSITGYYIHTDHLGTPRKLTRLSDNALMWRWDPGSFGSAAPNTNPSGQGAVTYNLRFPGMYYQTETGLMQNGYRDYWPSEGRYLEPDPIGLAGGSYSPYAYVGGNPVSRIDPLGLCGTDSNQHNYHIQRATLCSAAAAFSMLLAPGMSAPGAPAAQEGFTPQIVLTGNNPISQSVNSSTMTIVNTTLPTHSFYPGTVVIQVTPSGSNGSIINITGTGTSSDPLINDAVGLLFFGSVADLIAQMCSGSAGIPMP